jgi:hypothetical protein
MMLRNLGAISLLVCVGACSFDFTDLPRDVPVSLHVDLTTDSRTDQVTMSASLQPGREIDGSVRVVLEDLRDWNTTIEPTDISDNGLRIYEADWSLSTALTGGGGVHLRAPEVEGAQSVQQQVSIPISVRVGPDSLFVSGGDPVVLRLMRYGSINNAHLGRWNLQLSDSVAGTDVIIGAEGSPPAEIVVPHEWLDGRAAVYEAQLDILHADAGEFIPDRYRWVVTSRSQIFWTVVVTAP